MINILASGNLSQPTDGVVVVNQDGTMYLDSQTIPAETEISYNRLNIMGSDIKIPEGFFTDLGMMLTRVLTFVLAIAALLVFFYLIWGGIDWITSGGDKGKTDSARQKIVSAVVGLIIVAASFAILTIVLNFLGFESLQEVINQAIGASPTPTPTPSL